VQGKIREEDYMRMGRLVYQTPDSRTLGSKKYGTRESKTGLGSSFLEAAIERFLDHVQNLSAERVFDLDEIGIAESEDRTERSLVVPSITRGQTIHHDMHRNLNHISVVTHISAAGENMAPFLVCFQVNGIVERWVKT
jgi:hypothetical protein